MAAFIEAEYQGIRAWAEVLDSEFRLGTPVAQAENLLNMAYAHVQRASALGEWMYQVSKEVDQSTLEVHFWNLLDLCRLTESQVQASSPLGVWMREVSVRAAP